MSKINLSSIACVKRRYEFSDHSIVEWTPADNSGKAHGMFIVRICLKNYGPIRVVCEKKGGPPSEHASLHAVKLAIKDIHTSE